MAEYIEREALLALVDNRLSELRKIYGPFDHYTDGYDECVDRIGEFPATDVVEVVRCKDCKHSMLWRNPSGGAIGDCFIRKMNSEDEQFCTVGADDFCSYGERRGE